ncbi:MAG: acyl carrier protein [Myxococcota bacterium]|nr:acyl carrier protein [Myxococcota bacterium]
MIDTRARLYELILEIAPDVAPDLNDDARLVGDLGLESVQLLELAGDLEQSFSIKITEADLFGIETVSDFVKAIEQAVRSRALMA